MSEKWRDYEMSGFAIIVVRGNPEGVHEVADADYLNNAEAENARLRAALEEILEECGDIKTRVSLAFVDDVERIARVALAGKPEAV